MTSGGCKFQAVAVGGGDLSDAAVIVTPDYQTTTSFTQYEGSTTSVAGTIVVTACSTTNSDVSVDEGTVTFSIMVLK